MHSVERVMRAHKLIDEAFVTINRCVQSELGNVSVRELGEYLAGFQAAFVASEHFISILQGNGAISEGGAGFAKAENFWETKPRPQPHEKGVPF